MSTNSNTNKQPIRGAAASSMKESPLVKALHAHFQKYAPHQNTQQNTINEGNANNESNECLQGFVALSIVPGDI